MRLLVNENVAATVISELRGRGHDVLSVKESMRSEADDVILALAQAEHRIVVTHDKDFGELAFRSNLPAFPSTRAGTWRSSIRSEAEGRGNQE